MNTMLNTPTSRPGGCASGRRAIARPFAIVAVLTFALSTAACSTDSTGPGAQTELDGPLVTVGSGTAQTVVIKHGNTIRAISIRLTAAALGGLPSTMPATEWTLTFPPGASIAPWDHVALDWNPQGHPPPMVYTVPHFDVHFYMITPAQQRAIPGGPDTTTVAAQYVPQDYVSQVEAVPMMGVHWADTTASEYQGQPFDHTLIYGFYRGTMLFVEPMVTMAFLQSSTDFSGAVKQPQAFQRPGLYPTQYSVRHDASAKTITVSLDSLVSH